MPKLSTRNTDGACAARCFELGTYFSLHGRADNNSSDAGDDVDNVILTWRGDRFSIAKFRSLDEVVDGATSTPSISQTSFP